MDKYTQKTSSHSTGYQAGGDINIFQGISLQDAEHIAYRIFKENSLKLAGIAMNEAEKRIERFISRLMNEIVAEQPSSLSNFVDPDIQSILFEAQKGHARRDDPDLESVLIDLVKERSKRSKIRTLEITLNEAITIASKLETKHFAILALGFLLQYLAFTPQSKKGIVEVLNNLDPLLDSIDDCSFPTFQHLVSCSCITLDSEDSTFRRFLEINLLSRFEKSIDRSEVEYLGLSEDQFNMTFQESIEDSSRLYFKIKMNQKEYFETHLLALKMGRSPRPGYRPVGISDESAKKLSELYSKSFCHFDELQSLLPEFCPGFVRLEKLWDQSCLKRHSLSSVGLCIGYTYFKQIFGGDLDLSEFIY